MCERLIDALVSILIFHVLTDDTNLDLVLRRDDAIDEAAPGGHVGRRKVELEMADGQLIEIRPDPIPGGAPWGILEQLGIS